MTDRPSAHVARTVLALLLLVAVTVVCASPRAAAHADLESVVPAGGASLDEIPAEVVLTFNEDLSPRLTVVDVVDAEGLPMTQGDPVISGAVVTQALAETMHAGPYTISYKVVSADGHPISDASVFTIEEDAVRAGGESTSTTSSDSTSPTSSTGAAAPTPSPSTSAASPAGQASPVVSTLWLILLIFVMATITFLAVMARKGARVREGKNAAAGSAR